MREIKTIKPIAFIHTDFKEKFGLPRQSSLVNELKGEITFVHPFTNPNAIKGLEEYSHIWLLWGFSESFKENGALTVRPPRLGGKIKKGIFATRSPYRPNGIGLSSVHLDRIEYGEACEPHIYVSGCDMLDNTPIYDIKPYMPYTDVHEGARGGFGEKHKNDKIPVEFPENVRAKLPEEIYLAFYHLLEQDPRDAYNKEPGYDYGMSYAGYDIRFHAELDRIVVLDVVRQDSEENIAKIK